MLEAFLRSFPADVSAASGANLLALGTRASTIPGVKRAVTNRGLPLLVELDLALDGEEVARLLGWQLDTLHIHGFDQHASIPEVAVKPSPKGKPERMKLGSWTVRVVIHDPAVGPVASKLHGKPLAGSGAKIRVLQVHH